MKQKPAGTEFESQHPDQASVSLLFFRNDNTHLLGVSEDLIKHHKPSREKALNKVSLPPSLPLPILLGSSQTHLPSLVVLALDLPQGREQEHINSRACLTRCGD